MGKSELKIMVIKDKHWESSKQTLPNNILYPLTTNSSASQVHFSRLPRPLKRLHMAKPVKRPHFFAKVKLLLGSDYYY